jgi:DNA-binding NarL/FixJ family response regulator
VNKLPDEWVNGNKIPTGIVFSAFPIQQDLLIRGAMMLAHSGKKEARDLIEELFELLEAVTSLSFDLSRNEHSRRTDVGSPSIQSELTSRQLKVLTGIRDGLTNYQIARMLNVSESTVKQESIRIYKFLDVNNRADAVAVALEQGLIQEQTTESEAPSPETLSSRRG